MLSERAGMLSSFLRMLHETIDYKNPRRLRPYVLTGGIDSLEMYHHENMALRISPGSDPKAKDKKWWYCIDGDTTQTTNWTDWWLVFRLKKSFFRVGYGLTWAMMKVGIGLSKPCPLLLSQSIPDFPPFSCTFVMFIIFLAYFASWDVYKSVGR